MHKLKYAITIGIIIYFLTTKSVSASSLCATVPDSGNYHVSQADCYLGVADSISGLDDSGGSASSTTNAAILYIDAGASLTIPSGVSGTTTLATGTLILNGGSIILGSNSQIKVNQPLWYVDADGDGTPTSPTPALTKPTNGVRRSYLQRPNVVDCDDAQANVYYSHSACYWDLDGDGYTSNNTSGKTCLNNSSCNLATYGSTGSGVAPTSYTAGRLQNSASATADCDDSNVAVFGSTQGYVDADGDTYGASGSALVDTGTCGALPAGYASRLGDCADNNANVHWNATTCSGTAFTNYLSASSYDYNCDGTQTKCGTVYNLACSGNAAQDKGCIGTGSTGCSTNHTVTNYNISSTFSCGSTGCILATTGTRQTTCTTGTTRTGCKTGGGVAFNETVSSGVQACQ